MNSAEKYINDAQVLIIEVGASGVIRSNISCKKMDCLEMKILRHHVFLSWHDETFHNGNIKQYRGDNLVFRN